MISVSGVSMRYGSKVLFDDVTTMFSDGRRYGLTGPNGAGKSTFMKLLTGELPPQRGAVVRPERLGVLRQDQFAFDRFRVIDTVIMGNAVAVGGARGARPALCQGRAQRRRRDAAGRARGHDRRARRLLGRERRGGAARRPRHSRSPARAADVRAAGRAEGAGAAGPGALRPAAGAAARRADQPPRPRLDPLAARVPGALRGRAAWSSRTTATSSTPSAPTSPTSTTRRSSPTPAATTRWCWPRPRSARVSSRRTNSARRRSRS